MNSKRSILSMIIELMIDHAVWLTPLLLLLALATIAWILYRRFRARLELDGPDALTGTPALFAGLFKKCGWKPSREASSARAQLLTPEELEPFTSPLSIQSIETPSGPVSIIHCAWSQACPQGSVHALNKVMRELLEYAYTNGVWRIVVDIPSFGPTSRYFFHCLRDLGHKCVHNNTPSQGSLLIRFAPHPPGYTWFIDEPSTSYYALPESHSLEDCCKYIAIAPPLNPPVAEWD